MTCVRSILLVGFVLALSSGTATTGAADQASSFSVLVEVQASGYRFSVHVTDVTSVRVAILRLDGRRVFQSDWVAGPTVTWSLATSANHTPPNGVYLYAVSARDREGHEQHKLGKLVVSSGTASSLRLPSLDQFAGSQPSALPSGVKWQERLGKDSVDNFRIQRQPGKKQPFQDLLTLDNAGNLSVAQLCLSGVCFASWPSGGGGTFTLADGSVTLAKLANQDCGAGNAIRGWTGGVLSCINVGGGGGTPSGWVDDGTVVRLANATEKVGIGTNMPASLLHLRKDVPAGLGPTLTLYNGGGSGGAADSIDFFTYSSPTPPTPTARIMSIDDGSFSNHLAFFTRDPGDNSKPLLERMRIASNGDVGIGTNQPTATLTVRGSEELLQVFSSNGLLVLRLRSDGRVEIAAPGGSSTKHACYFVDYVFGTCLSAAEYVPTVDTGSGYPETGDLVHILPQTKNPYGDEHGPFVVAKTNKPCEGDLLGFIVNPESGADGKKLNEHYLPLAIYGYFPAKVTMENGAIKRGDPITSSSKPGYGMKAAQACKIVGYALEDADKEGTIQVFAHLSEYTAPEVTALRAQVQELKQQLQQVLSQIETMKTKDGSK